MRPSPEEKLLEQIFSMKDISELSSEEKIFARLETEIAELKNGTLILFFRRGAKGNWKKAFRDHFKDGFNDSVAYIANEAGVKDINLLRRSMRRGFARGISKESIGIVIPKGESIKGDTLEERIENETARLVRKCFQETEKMVKWPELRGKWLAEYYRDFPEVAEKHLMALEEHFIHKYGIGVVYKKEHGSESLPNDTLGQYASPDQALKALSAVYEGFRREDTDLVRRDVGAIYIFRDMKNEKKEKMAGFYQKGRIAVNADFSYEEILNSINTHEFTHAWQPEISGTPEEIDRVEDQADRMELHYDPDNLKKVGDDKRLKERMKKDADEFEAEIKKAKKYAQKSEHDRLPSSFVPPWRKQFKNVFKKHFGRDF